MKYVSSKIYDKKYYTSVCLGSHEFNQSSGKKLHPSIEKLLSKLKITSNAKILDLGCGRGDITLFLANRTKETIGIDYSKEAILIANNIKKKFPKKIQKKTHFYRMRAEKLKFPDNYFDLVICIDLFEHISKEELEVVLKEISRVLKRNGILFVHTGTNKLLNDFTYKYYILPMDRFLTSIDKKIKQVSYDPLPKDPRTSAEKEQHINEPNYFYLSNLFKHHNFNGKIEIEIGYRRPVKNIRSILYNFLTTLFPLSKFYPLSLLFGWAFVCTMRNDKSKD